MLADFLTQMVTLHQIWLMIHHLFDTISILLVPVLRLVNLYGSFGLLQIFLALPPLLEDLTYNTLGYAVLEKGLRVLDGRLVTRRIRGYQVKDLLGLQVLQVIPNDT